MRADDDKLAEACVTHPGVQAPLVITRVFKAGQARVWDALTTPEVLLQWHGPPFYPAVEVVADVRVGGAWRACLSSGRPGDVQLWQSGRYLVVDPPDRLEYSFEWETPDHEDGLGVVTVVRIRLQSLPNGDTQMHFSQTGFLSSASAASHSRGWNGTFDRLEDTLQKNRHGSANSEGGIQ